MCRWLGGLVVRWANRRMGRCKIWGHLQKAVYALQWVKNHHFKLPKGFSRSTLLDTTFFLNLLSGAVTLTLHNLLHCLPRIALYALGHVPNFYKIYPRFKDNLKSPKNFDPQRKKTFFLKITQFSPLPFYSSITLLTLFQPYLKPHWLRLPTAWNSRFFFLYGIWYQPKQLFSSSFVPKIKF
jgi:hypothetical protein